MANLKAIKGDTYGCDEEVTYLPTVRFNERDIPQMVDWEVGDKYRLIIEVEVSQLGQENAYEKGDGGDLEASVKLTKVGVDTTEKSYAEQVADAHKN
ncbi:hypothetical protein KA005_81375 [bacterium]|nr:hypothetical protein [bacterium]